MCEGRAARLKTALGLPKIRGKQLADAAHRDPRHPHHPPPPTPPPAVFAAPPAPARRASIQSAGARARSRLWPAAYGIATERSAMPLFRDRGLGALERLLISERLGVTCLSREARPRDGCGCCETVRCCTTPLTCRRGGGATPVPRAGEIATQA